MQRLVWIVDHIAAPLIYLLVAAYALHASITRPYHNWDAIGYVAAAKFFEERDPAALQQFTYRQLRNAVPNAEYEDLAQEADPGSSMRTRFRHAMSTDPAAFEEMLSFYRVRPVYNAFVYLAYKSGIDVVRATHLIPAIAVAIALALLCLAASALLARPFVYVLPLLALWFGVVDLARFSTPDGLSLLAVTVLAVLFLKGRINLLLLASPLAIGVRTDLILFTLPLLLWLFAFRPSVRWRCTISAVVLLMVYAMIVVSAHNPGWSTFFYCSVVERCIHPLSAPPTLHAATYFDALASGSGALMSDPLFEIHLAMVGASGLITLHMLRRSLRPWNSPFFALILVCLSYMLGRFLVLPDQWPRFFTTPYLLTAFSLFGLIGVWLREPQSQ
jgi:hypothetical protein